MAEMMDDGGMLKRGGKVKKKPFGRKRGGSIPGGKSMPRPDRASRGGSDGSPMSSAGKMSNPSYQRAQQPANDTGGAGTDK